MVGSRRLATLVAFLALSVAGCGGGHRTVSFGSATQPLLRNMIGAIEKNDNAAIDRALGAADKFLANKQMAQDEYDALKWAADQAKKGKGKEAKDFLDRCVAESKY